MSKVLILLGLSMFTTCLFAEAVQKDSENEDYTFKPVFLDGSDNEPAVLGIRYSAKEKWVICEREPQGVNGDPGDRFNNGNGAVVDQTTEKNCFIETRLEGLWTNDKKLNPESFSKVNLDIGYEVLVPDDVSKEGSQERDLEFGLQLALEGDQNYDNRQTVAALQAGATFGDSTKKFIAMIASYGEVDASEDDIRKAITDEEVFNRISVEIHTQIPLNLRKGRKYSPKAISINYRYYGEVDPPDSVEAVGQDEFQWGVVRLKFENGIYLAYSKGKLPFDTASDSALEVGFSHNLF